MTPTDGPADQQDLLDLVFDQAVRAFTDGAALPLDELRDRHPALQPQLDEVVQLARTVALVHAGGLPEVHGYEVLDELGRGGMGQVFLARQRTLGRLVALKVLPPGAAASSRSRARFAAEARALARVRHRNLVAVHDVVDQPDCCAYAMEFIQGRSLAQLLAAMPDPERRTSEAWRAALGAPPSVPAVSFHVLLCRLGIEVLSALDALHRAGLVHRDVKPANILVRPDGSAVLADLGLVHDAAAPPITRTGQFVGTPGYAAPEQRRGEAVGPWTDVWAVAATLCEALTGSVPEVASAPLRRLDRRLPPDLDTILRTALDPHPSRRYASAAAFAEDLERCLAFRPIHARPAPLLDRAGKWLWRRRTLLTALGVGALLALVLGALWSEHRAWRNALPGRSAAEVEQARLLLLWPAHGERIEWEFLVGAPRPQGGLLLAEQAALAKALERYAEGERLAPLQPAVALEHEVVQHAQRRALGGPALPVSSGLRTACPATARALGRAPQEPPFSAAEARSAAREDRRLLGLYAYLLGLPSLCHAAWEPLELDRLCPDPMVDAAAGTLHLMLHDAPRAVVRLDAAFRAFPQAGFLAVRAADAACLNQDLPAAEHYLAAAAGLGHQDSFGTEQRVRMELLAARGRWDEADALLRAHLTEHQGIEARRRMADRCIAAERWPSALRLSLELKDRTYLPEQPARLRRALDGWWRSRTFGDLVACVLGEGEPRPAALRALLLAAFEESPTPGARSPAGLPHRPDWRDLAFTMEALQMDSGMARHAPVWLRRAAATLGILADSEVGRRAPLVRGAAFVALRSAAVLGGLLPLFAGAQPNWAQVLTPVAPPARWYAAMAFDEARGEMVLFGGVGWNGTTRVTLGDTWRWTAAAGWQQVFPANSPSARHGAAMVYDARRQVITLFGGYDTAHRDDLWDWNGTHWSPTPVTGPSPAPRNSPGAAFDRRRGCLVVFGGSGAAGFLADTWEWSSGAWTLVPTAIQPSARYVGRMVFDEVRDRAVLFGGWDDVTNRGDTWTWDGTNWLLSATGGPAPRHSHAMAWDPDRRVSVLSGGFPIQAESWDWNGTAWLRRTPISNPGNRWGMCLAYDRVGRRTVLFGGSNAASGTALPASTLNDTWAYSSTPPAQWTPFGAGCGTPAPTLVANTLPWIGQVFDLTLGNPPAGTASLLLVGVSDATYLGAPLPLPMPGPVPNCQLLVSIDAMVFPTGAGPTWSVQLPSGLMPGDQVFLQALSITPSLGLLTSSAGRAVFGCP